MNAEREFPQSVFDSLAPTYDESFSDTRLGVLLRAAVRRRIVPLLAGAGSVADIGCGTGLDSAWLAAMGKRVTAIDPSACMVAITRRRLEQEGLGANVEVIRQDLEEFTRTNERMYDLVISNFGALNCVDALVTQLKRLSTHQPIGGRAALVLMNRSCLWEQAWFMVTGRPRLAFRRFSPAVFRAGGQQMSVYYPKIGQLVDAIAPEYRLQACFGIGVLLPPSYLAPVVARLPWIFEQLARLEHKLAHRVPFKHIADHVLLVVKRTQ